MYVCVYVLIAWAFVCLLRNLHGHTYSGIEYTEAKAGRRRGSDDIRDIYYLGFWHVHSGTLLLRMVLCRVVALFNRINVDSLRWVDLRRGSFGV